MNLLIDTHVLLWWLDDPLILSMEACKAIEEGKNAAYVSAAAAWEITIKKLLGKLDAPDDLERMMSINRFQSLAITVRHAVGVASITFDT
jgi:PIN domain nuclease of toxin-antitoxin system